MAEIDIVDADARELPFSDGSFNVVVSNFVVHNIKSEEGRRKAILEMWRVLSPNGRLVISDFSKTAEYIQILNSVSNRVEIKQFFIHFRFQKLLLCKRFKKSINRKEVFTKRFI
ncbi:class I SAM-dependent methyltransferase [Lysinibacillus sp. NPDC056232]|uniref:class I SAM-dependent methyltransferase n=1 Tax=Lysinibacillus sp. NPDC056232 TaxID=3345756 RepID=UPI0035E2AE14